MSHTIVITTVKQAVAELTDEEYEEFSQLVDLSDQEYFLDIWISDSDTVERTIEEV